MSDKSVPGSQFARRDFLKFSSVAIFGIAGGVWPSFALGQERKPPASLLSVGYAEREPEEGALVWLSSADELLAGDPAFISRGARVTIRSSSRIAARSMRKVGAAIGVVYPAFGYQPDAYPIYRAWSCRDDQYLQSTSAPVAFRVPIDATNGLRLLLTRFDVDSPADSPDTPIAAADDAVIFSLGSASGEPKLQRGVYVISYRERDNHPDPNWSSVAITRRDGILVVQTETFSHLVLSIDYAS